MNREWKLVKQKNKLKEISELILENLGKYIIIIIEFINCIVGIIELILKIKGL